MTSKFCYSCGTPRDPDGRFCGTCGADLGAAYAVTEQPGPPLGAMAGDGPVPPAMTPPPVQPAPVVDHPLASPAANGGEGQPTPPEQPVTATPASADRQVAYSDSSGTHSYPVQSPPWTSENAAPPQHPAQESGPAPDPAWSPEAPGVPQQPWQQEGPAGQPWDAASRPAPPVWGTPQGQPAPEPSQASYPPYAYGAPGAPYAVPGPGQAPQPTAASVVPTFDSLNVIMKDWNVKAALPTAAWALLPPVAVGLALGFWFITQGVGASSIPGSIGIMIGLTFGGSVAFGEEGLLNFTMLASSVTLASVLVMILGMRSVLRRSSPRTTVESLQRVSPVVVLVPVAAAILNLLANTMTGDAIAYAEPTSTFGRTLFGALLWTMVAAGIAILAAPATESVRTRMIRDLLDAPAAGLAVTVFTSGVVALVLGAVSLMTQGGVQEFLGGFIFLLIQLPTLALALIGAAVFAPFDVGFLGLGVSGTIVDAADENPWLWLLPVGYLAVGVLGAGWMLLRRADATRAKVDLATFVGLAAVVGVLSAAIVSVNLQALGQGLSLKLSGAIVLILPLAALLWWFLATLVLGRMTQGVRPGSTVTVLPWKKAKSSDQ